MTRSALQTSLLWVLVATGCGAPARSPPPLVAGPPDASTTHAVATQPAQSAAADAPPPWLDDALSAPEARPEEAMRALEATVERDPDDTIAHLRLARLEALWGEASAAEARWTLATGGDPIAGASGEALLTRALVLASSGHVAASRTHLEAALAARSRATQVDDEAQWSLAAGRGGAPLRAEAAFSTLTRAHPASEGAWALYGEWHRRAGRAERALDVLTRARQALPASLRILRATARAYGDAGRSDDAAEAWQQVARHAPDDVEAQDELALGEAHAGDTDAALTRWTRLLARATDAMRPRLRASQLLAELKRPREAARMLEPLVDQRPLDAGLRSRLAQMLLECDRPDVALVHADVAVRAAPDDPLAHTMRGASLAALERWLEALDAHETASMLAPDDVGLHRTAAAVALKVEDHATARRHLEAVLARRPDDRLARRMFSALTGTEPPPLTRWPAASAMPDLATLAARVVAGEDEREATVLRDERVVAYDHDGIESITHRRAILVHTEAGARRFSTVGVPFNAQRAAEVLVARTLTPEGATLAVPDDAQTVEIPETDAPMQSDARELRLRFGRVGPGAVVEYAVRVPRPHPDDLGVWWDRYVLGNVDPTVRAEYRLEGPEAGPLPTLSVRGVQPLPAEVAAGRRVSRFTAEDLPAFALEGQVRDADRVPTVSVASTRAWSDVDAWYARLFMPAASPTEPVRALATRLQRAAPTRRARIAAAFDYVEREIDYLGLELGIGAFRPRSAAETLERGTGDCKDMTALMVALLTAMNIDAFPALVRPEGTTLFDEAHPTPGLFNHVVLYVPDRGGDLWLDATASLHTLDAIPAQLRGRNALVVDGRGGQRRVVPAARPRDHVLSESIDWQLTPTAGGTLSRSVVLRGDPAGEVRQRLVHIPAADRDAVLRAPGVALGARYVPTAVEVDGLDVVTAPLNLRAQGADRDLAGLGADGTIALRLSLARWLAPALGGPFEDSRPPGARQVRRTWRFEFPSGYAIGGAARSVTHRGRHLDFSLRETRSGAQVRFEVDATLRAPPRSVAESATWADELTTLAARVDTTLRATPPPSLDRVALHRALVAEQPESEDLAVLLARTLLRAGQADEAVRVLDPHVGVERRTSPEALAAWLWALGASSAAADRFDEAAARAAAQPREGRVQHALGDLAGRVRRIETAEAAYRRALEVAPDNPIALNNLAWLLREQPTQRAEAVKLAERSVELDPDSPAAWDTLAELRALTTDWSGALDAVERARALPGADAATLNAKAEAYRAARDAAPRAESP